MIFIYRPSSTPSAAGIATRGLAVLVVAVIALVVLGVAPELALAFSVGAAFWTLRLATRGSGTMSRRVGG